jgi:hypothetical protein
VSTSCIFLADLSSRYLKEILRKAGVNLRLREFLAQATALSPVVYMPLKEAMALPPLF